MTGEMVGVFANYTTAREHKAKYAYIGDVLYTHPNGEPMTRVEWYRRVKREEELFDRLALEAAQHERDQGNRVPEWLKRAEASAWKRARKRDQG